MLDLITYLIVLLSAASLVNGYVKKKKGKIVGGCSTGGSCSTCKMCNKFAVK